MEFEIRPEPPADERAALSEALARALETRNDPERSAWWREGVRESVGEDPADVRRA